MAYIATVVLPADVCADTKTFSRFSIARIDCFWNESSSYSNLYSAKSDFGYVLFLQNTDFLLECYYT